ncbi:hypothetical protein GUITHDRAFT_65959 [Guillardia theta CCMP2712]|uniref:Aldehyde dehydrogenase domain-containing protein n=1 Tax=Guillardia theta (strain CCMP2712) TaxID=905079 RepID=L1JT19_GUITC|nr:hypothetical protein GUITHDRAFT_65959 [Guillardia theta CCMP2712]EKX51449.1 hypothetical protein GUITHDRAFT_65959 [Guillardia theta CCMP2712]|eukprot:XP_005838429.1 hypothetical protein GUITHDRAFT_65959 [Guillardia theta CCMP2712]
MLLVNLSRSSSSGAAAVFRLSHAGKRFYNFGTSAYKSAFGNPPAFDSAGLRERTIDYMKKFDEHLWHKDPIRTIVKGKDFLNGVETDTTNAIGNVNGKQILGDEEAFDAIREHLSTSALGYEDVSKCKELMEAVRQLEADLLDLDTAAILVGNQSIDFGKQDGITEIEESAQANKVERRLADLLLEDHSKGMISVRRDPVFVSCVSNFSNFLDLFRKVVRNIEFGIPVVVLSRGNTQQHSFRWTQLLLQLMRKHRVPLELVTFASLTLANQQKLLSMFPSSPTHFTGSREVAREIKKISPKTLASTGGPNTMIATKLTNEVQEAIRMSACIENSGQCTALRHVVAPISADHEGEKTVSSIFSNSKHVNSALEAIEAKEFSAFVSDLNGGYRSQVYSQLKGVPVSFRINDSLPDDIEENWREVYLDFTSLTPSEIASKEKIEEIAQWLRKTQPISLSVNADMATGLQLWEKCAMVVYTQGTPENPALSCQARPQDGECFGEFPPRAIIHDFTRFPMVIPSPTPSYNSTYEKDYLKKVDLSMVPKDMVYFADVSVP